jgi:hypothetical protein
MERGRNAEESKDARDDQHGAKRRKERLPRGRSRSERRWVERWTPPTNGRPTTDLASTAPGGQRTPALQADPADRCDGAPQEIGGDLLRSLSGLYSADRDMVLVQDRQRTDAARERFGDLRQGEAIFDIVEVKIAHAGTRDREPVDPGSLKNRALASEDRTEFEGLENGLGWKRGQLLKVTVSRKCRFRCEDEEPAFLHRP